MLSGPESFLSCRTCLDNSPAPSTHRRTWAHDKLPSAQGTAVWENRHASHFGQNQRPLMPYQPTSQSTHHTRFLAFPPQDQDRSHPTDIPTPHHYPTSKQTSHPKNLPPDPCGRREPVSLVIYRLLYIKKQTKLNLILSSVVSCDYTLDSNNMEANNSGCLIEAMQLGCGLDRCICIVCVCYSFCRISSAFLFHFLAWNHFLLLDLLTFELNEYVLMYHFAKLQQNYDSNLITKLW